MRDWLQIESYYHITDGPTAFIFPAGVAGYLFATLIIQKILDEHGWRGIALFASASRLAASLLLSTGPPFYIVLLAYFILGFGIGLSDSGFCAWGSKVPLANIVQGMMHGSFSAGALLGPILALYLARRAFGWYTFYQSYVSGFIYCLTDVSMLKIARPLCRVLTSLLLAQHFVGRMQQEIPAFLELTPLSKQNTPFVQRLCGHVVSSTSYTLESSVSLYLPEHILLRERRSDRP